MGDGVVRETHAGWMAEAKRRFAHSDDMAFVCPNCAHVATVQDFIGRGLRSDAAAQNCLGRFDPSIKCDWAAYGLFSGPNFVVMPDGDEVPVFAFATGTREEARTDA